MPLFLIIACNDDNNEPKPQEADTNVVYEYVRDVFTESWYHLSTTDTTIHETNLLAKIEVINEEHLILYIESDHFDTTDLYLDNHQYSNDYTTYSNDYAALVYPNFDSLVLMNTLYAMSGSSAITYFTGKKD